MITPNEKLQNNPKGGGHDMKIVEPTDAELEALGFENLGDYGNYQQLEEEDTDPYLTIARENHRGL